MEVEFIIPSDSMISRKFFDQTSTVMVTNFVFSSLGHMKGTRRTVSSISSGTSLWIPKADLMLGIVLHYWFKIFRVFKSEVGIISLLEAILMTQMTSYF